MEESNIQTKHHRLINKLKALRQTVVPAEDIKEEKINNIRSSKDLLDALKSYYQLKKQKFFNKLTYSSEIFANLRRIDKSQIEKERKILKKQSRNVFFGLFLSTNLFLFYQKFMKNRLKNYSFLKLSLSSFVIFTTAHVYLQSNFNKNYKRKIKEMLIVESRK